MNRIFLFIVLCAATVAAVAQGSLKGKVIDKQTNEALQFVNIKVEQSATGKMLKGAITDANGAFHITGLPYGKYNLTVSFVGYKNFSREFAVSASKKQASFPAIYLAEDSHALKEVQVTGQRSQMKLEVDRKTFTADQMIAAAGGSASDLLESIPSVEVSTEGEVSLRGNTSVEVWINGKSSGLTSDNRGEILQQIPAESIERIEVIDNPSAKYSPEGSAGIINIILKRDRKAGYYGSVRAGVNTRGGWQTGANINYSSGKIDAFANLGYKVRRHKGGASSEQVYTNSNTYQNYYRESDNKGGNLFARAGLTWHMTTNDDLSLSGMTMAGSRDNTSLTPYHYGTVGAPVDTRMMFRQTDSKDKDNMYHAELEYTHKFSEKHTLDFNIEYNTWKSDNDNYYRDSTLWMDGTTPTTRSCQYRPMYINNRSVETRLDYENQISDKLKVEAGYNGTYSRENTPQESWIDNSDWYGKNSVEDKAYYNRFIYEMSTHALYATVNAKFGKFGAMAGLRGEYWRVNTESRDYWQEYGLADRDPAFKKNFFKLFPSLFLNYELTPTAQLQLNYTRRMHRPWGGQLNSFRDTRDASIVSFGNPELTPEYTNSFSLNFLKTWPEHTLSVGAYYRPTTDVIQRISYNVNDTIYSTNENVAKSQSAGLEVILKNKLFRILDLTTTVNAYYYKLDGFSYAINNQVVTGASDENFSWDARMLASIVLPYGISIQATGNYRSRSVVTQGYRKANASLDLGLRKTFFNKALALSINCRDVFNTRKWDTYTSSDAFTRHQRNWRKPHVNFVLTWNFGNMNGKKRTQPDDSSSDDQQSYGGYGEN